jgi:16S rRNA (cytosine967-C5)-methyltransferase
MRFSRPLLDACTAAFAAVLPLAEPADASLSAFFRGHPKIGQRDRSVIADSVYAALRRRRSLERLVGQASPRRLVLATWSLLLGASLRELEPWLRGEEPQWLAVVKRDAAAGQSIEIQSELPDWVIEKLRGRFDGDALLELARGLMQTASLDLRVNSMKTTREAATNRLAETGVAASATPYSPDGLRLEGRPAINRHPVFLEGGVEVQDEGSQLLCHLVAPKRGEMVVDYCAGAGGKTLALGALMRSTGRPMHSTFPRSGSRVSSPGWRAPGSRTSIPSASRAPATRASSASPERSIAFWSTRPAADWARCAGIPT